MKYLTTAAALAFFVSMTAAARADASPDTALDGDAANADVSSDDSADVDAARADANDALAEPFDADDGARPPNLDAAYTSPSGCACTMAPSANDLLPPVAIAAALAFTAVRRRRT